MNALEKSVLKDTAFSAGLLGFAVVYLAIAVLRGPALPAPEPAQDTLAGQAARGSPAVVVAQPPSTAGRRA